MTDLTFRDMVSQLTETHPVGVDRDTGREYHNEPGLLAQLRRAVTSGMESGGTGASFGSKPPLDAGAYDLLDEIDRQAAEALSAATKRPVGLGTTEEYVSEWSELIDPEIRVVVSVRQLGKDKGDRRPRVYLEAREHTALSLVTSWYLRVTGFFDPSSRREILAPCPNCGVEFDTTSDDGVPRRVMWFRRDKETRRTVDAHCDACDASWPMSQMINFGRMVGAIEADEDVEDILRKLA